MKKLLFLLVSCLLLVSCNYTEKQAKNAEKRVNDSIEKIAIDSNNQMKTDSLNKSDSIRKVYAELNRTNAIKNSIRVTSCSLSEPNSAGGCDANFHYINKSGKTIKYVTFDASSKNAVGDIVTSEIGSESTFSGKDTGPVKNGRSGGGSWDCVIYNWSAKRMVVNSIDIEYMDATTIMISGKDLKLIGLKDRQINI